MRLEKKQAAMEMAPWATLAGVQKKGTFVVFLLPFSGFSMK
jgi:hypothetical protein